MLLYKIMIKCADVSNPSKEMAIYDPWCRLLMEEFIRQGDMEKKLLIPVSPYCDRENMNVPSSQCGFIDYVVMPLFESLDKYIAVPQITKTLVKNREYWYAFLTKGDAEIIGDHTVQPGTYILKIIADINGFIVDCIAFENHFVSFWLNF